MRERTVNVYAPASISNLGSAFDVLGLAIDRPGDIVVAARTAERGLVFSLRPAGSGLPAASDKNVAGHVVRLMLDELKPAFGVKMTLRKQMPIGSGLGSSAASSVAAAVAMNALLPRPLRKHDLLRFAVEGERLASGSAHADNVAPSLLGGVQLVRSYDPLDVVSIPAKQSLVWVVVHPRLVVLTGEARAVLPRNVGLRLAVRQWGNVGGLIAGLITGNAKLVGKCLEDVIVEPVRACLVPGFTEVQRAALESGAAGCTLSGSGPAMFGVTSSEKVARTVARVMREAFARIAGVESTAYISRVNMQGATTLPVFPR